MIKKNIELATELKNFLCLFVSDFQYKNIFLLLNVLMYILVSFIFI